MVERISGRHIWQFGRDTDDQLGLGRQIHQEPAPSLESFDQLLARGLKLQSRLAEQLGHQRPEDFRQWRIRSFLLQQIALAAGPIARSHGPDTLMDQRRLTGTWRTRDQQDSGDAIAAHLSHLLDQLQAFSLPTEQGIIADHGRCRIEAAQAERIDTPVLQPLLLAPDKIRGHRFGALIAGLRLFRQALEQHSAESFRQVGDMHRR